MLNRIGSIIGWVGTALVFAAVAIRFLRPEWDRYAHWGAWAGLVCVLVMAGDAMGGQHGEHRHQADKQPARRLTAHFELPFRLLCAVQAAL